MAAVSKTKKIELLAKLLQKRIKGLPVIPERTVLEHLIYAALLENASFELADAAFAVLENYFIDWNEVRVSTVRELADTFSMLPDPTATGDRVRRSLQGVFEKTYMFDLEELRKKGKNLSQSIEFLREIPSCTRFMVDYTAQVAFGGHLIPLDEASLRIFRLLGLTQVNKEGTLEEVSGLERAIAKKEGWSFSFQLHHFAVDFYTEPTSSELRTLLKTIDPEVAQRDWTPPVLIVPQTQTKPAPQRPLPVVALPFAAPDDDDFEEESVGTEAEFLPDDSPFRPEDHSSAGRFDDEDGLSLKSGKKGKENKEKKKAVSTPKSVETSPSREAEKKISPATVAPLSESSEKETPKKNSKLPKSTEDKKQVQAPSKKETGTQTTKKSPAKESAKPTTPKTSTSPSDAPSESKSGKPPHPEPPSKPAKSSTRQLREKKPK